MENKAKKKIITIVITVFASCLILIASLLVWMAYDDRELLYEPNIELYAPQPEGGDESYLLLLEAFDLSWDEISEDLRRSHWVKNEDDDEKSEEAYKQLILSKEEEINKLYQQVIAKFNLWRELAQLDAIGGENETYSNLTTEEVKSSLEMVESFQKQLNEELPKIIDHLEEVINSEDSISDESINLNFLQEFEDEILMTQKAKKATSYFTREKQHEIIIKIQKIETVLSYKLQLDIFLQTSLNLEPSMLLYEITQKWFPYQRYMITHMVGLSIEHKLLNLWNEYFESFNEKSITALRQLNLTPRTIEQEKNKMIRVAWSEYYFASKASLSVDWKQIVPFWLSPFINNYKMLNDLAKFNHEFETLLDQYEIEKTHKIIKQRAEEQKVDLRNLLNMQESKVPLMLLKKYNPKKHRSDRKTTEEVRQELMDRLQES